MWRTSRTIFFVAALPRRREVQTFIAPVADEMFTVTGAVRPASSTRTSIQLALSNSKGGSEYQPWLKTVRRKLKSAGVLMLISMQIKRDGLVATHVDVCIRCGQPDA